MGGAHTAQAARYVAERLNADFGFYLSDRRTLAQRQSPWQHIEVFENPQFGRVMRIDGCFMTSERDEFFYHEPMVHLPAIAHPGVRRDWSWAGGTAAPPRSCSSCRASSRWYSPNWMAK